MYKNKTRVAYATLKGVSNTNVFRLCDTVEEALKANMHVRDYEKQLVEVNPKLNITFKVERV